MLPFKYKLSIYSNRKYEPSTNLLIFTNKQHKATLINTIDNAIHGAWILTTVELHQIQ